MTILEKDYPAPMAIVYPLKYAGIYTGRNIIIGNVAFYGATSGEAIYPR